MCGRFALITPPVRLARYFQAALDDTVEPEQSPSFNVAPTDQVYGVDARYDPETGELGRRLRAYRWGLIPSWAKDPSAGSRLFNARSESVTTKSSFRTAFQKRRVIIPADGFYEWHTLKAGKKQPHYFSRIDGSPMAFAGVAEWWRDRNLPDDAPWIHSCSIITSSAGQDMDGIHDRMPVILDPSTFELWLDPANEDTSELRSLLHGAPAGTLHHHPVGPQVGNVRNNDPSLVTALVDGPADPSAQGSLFPTV
jgi:putative SOS response-associated peptidase YedK